MSDIGRVIKTITVEPIENPVPLEPTPEPQREPEPVGA